MKNWPLSDLKLPQILIWPLWAAFPLQGVVATHVLLPRGDGYTHSRLR